MEFCFCPVFSSSSVTDLTTRQRIHHLEFLQLNRRAVVIGVIVIVWFLRACDNLCPLRLCDLVDPATKIFQDSQRPSRLPVRAKIIPWTVNPTFEVYSQRCSVSGKEHCSIGVYFHVFSILILYDPSYYTYTSILNRAFLNTEFRLGLTRPCQKLFS